MWLSEDESRIYDFLLHHPLQTLSDISKELNINRPKLYQVLPYMEETGLVWVSTKGKRKLYIAEDPKILHTFFETIKQDFESLVPEIEHVYKSNVKKPKFKHLKWEAGVRNVFLDVANTLNTWDVFYRYSSRTNVKKTSIPFPEYRKYKKIRNEKKLERMVITNEYLNSIKPNKLEKEVVVIPKEYDLFEDNITKIIYGPKVAVIDYNSLESFIIESPVFANFERKIFKLLFKFLSKK